MARTMRRRPPQDACVGEARRGDLDGLALPLVREDLWQARASEQSKPALALRQLQRRER